MLTPYRRFIQKALPLRLKQSIKNFHLRMLAAVPLVATRVHLSLGSELDRWAG